MDYRGSVCEAGEEAGRASSKPPSALAQLCHGCHCVIPTSCLIKREEERKRERGKESMPHCGKAYLSSANVSASEHRLMPASARIAPATFPWEPSPPPLKQLNNNVHGMICWGLETHICVQCWNIGLQMMYHTSLQEIRFMH